MRVEEASAPILAIVASETAAALAAATIPGSMPPRLLLARLCERCNVFYVIENPATSWLWKQSCWSRRSGVWNDFVVDYCIFKTPWRKRTRFRTSSCLGGWQFNCNCGKPHLQLRGYNKAKRMSWTLCAQPYPRGLRNLLSGALASDCGLRPKCSVGHCVLRQVPGSQDRRGRSGRSSWASCCSARSVGHSCHCGLAAAPGPPSVRGSSQRSALGRLPSSWSGLRCSLRQCDFMGKNFSALGPPFTTTDSCWPSSRRSF